MIHAASVVAYPRCVGMRDRTRRIVVATAVAAAVAAVAVVSAWQPWVAEAAPIADDKVVAEGPAPAFDAPIDSSIPEASGLTPASLEIPAGASVVVYGDSWTFGAGATFRTDGYAYVLGTATGWDTTVLGYRGSGYLRAGSDGPSFPEGIARLDTDPGVDLVIIQGSINDRRQGSAGYTDAVETAWDELAEVYPSAQIVVLGPAPQVLPVESETARIDRDLRELAAERDWWYISPIDEDWITDENYLDVIDTSEAGANHPSTEGHAYLAGKVESALFARSAASDAAEPVEEPQAGR